MNTTKLKNVCVVVSGTTPKSTDKRYWNGTHVWITPAELSEDSFIVTDSERHITDEAIKATGLKSFPKGTVLLSSRAPIGKVAIAGCEMYCNQGFKNLICSESIYNLYLYYFLKSKTAYLNSLGRGATFKEISKGIVEDISIPFPVYSEQIRIAKQLQKISELISLKKGQYRYFDDIIRSRFIEMFGDPQSNCYNWKIVPLKDVMVGGALNGYFTKPQNYDIEGNVGVICVSDVVNRKYTNVNALRRAFASEKDLQKYCVKYGDMLFCRSSLVKEGIGKASIIPPHTENDILFECHVIKITLDMSRVIPEYLQALSITDFFRIQVIRQSKTATMTTIGQKDIASVNILLPPMELQKRFIEFSAQIDKSKLAVQKSLDELEILKKSLMQTYFG